MRIFPVVKKLVTVVTGGGSNTLTEITPGIELTQRFTLSSDEAVEPGIAISQGPITAQITQSPGVALTPSASGAPQVTQSPGIQLSQRFTQSNPDTPVVPGLEMVQVTYALTKLVGANQVTESAVGGRTDWANDTNATGSNNGTMATFAGNATGARGGQLNLNYADVTGKSDLTITLVELLFYGRVFNTTLNNGDLQLLRVTAGNSLLLETITGDVDFRTTPRTHDITAIVAGNWANIDGLSAHVRAEAALGAVWQAELDAVVLRVLANVTDTL